MPRALAVRMHLVNTMYISWLILWCMVSSHLSTPYCHSFVKPLHNVIVLSTPMDIVTCCIPSTYAGRSTSPGRAEKKVMTCLLSLMWEGSLIKPWQYLLIWSTRASATLATWLLPKKIRPTEEGTVVAAECASQKGLYELWHSVVGNTRNDPQHWANTRNTVAMWLCCARVVNIRVWHHKYMLHCRALLHLSIFLCHTCIHDTETYTIMCGTMVMHINSSDCIYLETLVGSFLHFAAFLLRLETASIVLPVGTETMTPLKKVD